MTSEQATLKAASAANKTSQPQQEDARATPLSSFKAPQRGRQRAQIRLSTKHKTRATPPPQPPNRRNKLIKQQQVALAAKNSLESITNATNTDESSSSSASATPLPEPDQSEARSGLNSRADSLASVDLAAAAAAEAAVASTSLVEKVSSGGNQTDGAPKLEPLVQLAGNAEKAAPKAAVKAIKVSEDEAGLESRRLEKSVGRRFEPPTLSSRVSIVVPSSESQVAQRKRQPFMCAGILASALGSVFFSLSIICVKLLPDSGGLAERTKALFFRGFFMSLLCAGSILYQRTGFKVPREEIWVNMLRCLFGTVGVFGSYCSLKYISTGDSTALIFSSPIWTTILSHFIFKEPLRWTQLLALPASLFGILLIAHPALILSTLEPELNSVAATPATPTTTGEWEAANASRNVAEWQQVNNTSPSQLLQQTQENAHQQVEEAAAWSQFDFEHRWPGIAIALGVSLLVSCNYIVLKYRKRTSIQVVTFWFGASMVAASLALACFTGLGSLPNTLGECLALLGLGFFSWLGQSCLQWAIMHEQVGVLSIVRTLDVAATFFFSALFLSEQILWTSILGAAIIGLVVISIMLSGWISKLGSAQAQARASEELETAAASKEANAERNQPGSIYAISKA